jgi:hypothetical protein
MAPGRSGVAAMRAVFAAPSAKFADGLKGFMHQSKTRTPNDFPAPAGQKELG